MNQLQPKTLIIIPAYNEGARIGEVIRRVREIQPDLAVVVINDGSRDDTVEAARAAGAVVISHPFNLGYWVAIQTGYKYALAKGYDFVVQMDGDGQHDPEELPRFIHAHQKNPDKIIVGSRMHAKEHIPRARYNSMHVARFYISLAANQWRGNHKAGAS